jgi:hypothetical protein
VGKFVKGQSGNPGGRPKELTDVKALAREYTAESITGLAAIARDVEQSGSARVAAWATILDRAWGKPQQQLDVTVAHSFTEALRQIERIARTDPAEMGTSVAEVAQVPPAVRH